MDDFKKFVLLIVLRQLYNIFYWFFFFELRIILKYKINNYFLYNI